LSFLFLLLACDGESPGSGEDDSRSSGDDSGTVADDSGGDDTGKTAPPIVLTIHVDAANVVDKMSDGTAEHPFADLASAFDAVEHAVAQTPKPAVVVEVATGTYDSSALLLASGTKNAPITIRGSGEARPVVDGLAKAATAIYLSGDYIVLENMEMANTESAGVAIKGNHVTVRGCVISTIGCCGRGIGVAFVQEESTDILIEKTTFFDTGLRGIEADGVTHSVFRDNVFFDTGSPILDEAAFLELTDASDVLVENNYFRDELQRIDHGVLVEGGSDLLLRRNLFVDLDKSAIRLDGSDSVTLAHNTLVTFTDRSRATALLAIAGAPTGLVSTGNVLTSADSGPLVSVENEPATSDWIDRNDYWKTGTGAWFELADESGTDLAGWTKATGFDTLSLAADPMMVGAWARAYPSLFAPTAKSAIHDTYPGPTEVTAAGTGTVVHVVEASMFSDGLGLTPPDVVVIAGKSGTVTAVDGDAGTITLETGMSVSAGDPVAFPSAGKGPDYGAVEADMETEIGTAAGGSVAFD
jgi:hypothetical protein